MSRSRTGTTDGGQMATRTNNRKESFDVPMKPSRCYAKVRLTNKPKWGRAGDGTPRHATVPASLLQAVHGDGFGEKLALIAESLGEDAETTIVKESSGYALKDFDAEALIQYCRTDELPFEEAVKLALPPSEEEIAFHMERVKLPDDWEEVFRQQEKRDPPPEDIAATIRQMAIREALDRGTHQLMGLPPSVLEEIADGHMAVYVVGPSSDGSKTRYNTKPIPIADLIALAYEGGAERVKTLPDDFASGAARGLCLTTVFEFDNTCRWVCYIERPTPDRRGFLIAFPFEVIADAIRTKHEWIMRVFPTLLLEDMHPACRWQPPRQRTRHVSRDRRHPYAPRPPREDAGTKEEPTPPDPDQDPNNQEPDQDNDDSEPSEADESA
ncbi:MAG: hypothetical protein V1745_01950 [Patescibacteria group bacterium]